MTTATPALKIGPTLEDLAAFYQAVDDAMDAVNAVGELIVPESGSRDVWYTISGLLSELSASMTEGHPRHDEHYGLK